MKTTKLKKYIYDKYISNTEIWNIGFVNLDIQNILEADTLNTIWMKHSYNDRWFADPFILSTTPEQIILLVEEYYLPLKKGRISRLIIDRKKYRLLSCDVVLELASHLSFPAIFRIGQEIYIYPENSNIGKLLLYKYFEESNKAEMVSELINEPLTDAIITTFFNKFYVLSTKKPIQNKNILNIYSSNKIDGVYSMDHTFVFEDNCARNGGELFYINDKHIRPAQDCNGKYGKGLVLQEVLFKDNKFSFKELKRFYPTSRKWNTGMHTMNVYNGIIAIDGRRYYAPRIRYMLLKLRKVISILRSGISDKR
ncbi:MAG: hypothetical protein LBB89_03535 [Treponema sp.]|jgi:hypothetical protein|nr:hypothetical protein [Treponema sp.]